jgi:outer membrane receptor for ferrienterochelin and colicins
MFKKLYLIVTLLFIIFILLLFSANSILASESQEPFFSLEEVVVIASKFPQKLLNSLASVEIINEEKIAVNKAENLAVILKNIAGLEITDYGTPGDIKSISIRGSSPEQVLVMIDGQVVNDPQTGKIDLGLIPADMIERIEIYRGPASALYGANALGGVINIITKKGGDKKGTVEINYGNYHTQKYQASYQNRSDDIVYFFTGEYYKTEGERENSELNKLSLMGKISKEIDSQTDLDFTIRFHDHQRGIPGSMDFPSPNARQDDRNFNVNTKWQKKEENRDFNIMAWYDFHQLCYDNPDEWGYTGASIHKNHTIGISFDSTYYDFVLGNKEESDSEHTLTWGGDIGYNRVDSTDIGKHQNLLGAVFIQDVWQLEENWSITAGLRYDYNQLFDGQFNPRIGLTYNLRNDLSLHASVGRAYRAPTYDDLYWPEDGFVGGNPNLLPEIAWAYEAGMRFINEKGDTQAELNIFRKNVRDLINWAADSEGVWRPSNISSARVEGLEIITRKEFNNHLTANLNYTYLNAIDLEIGTLLKPKHKYGLGLTYFNQFGKNKDDFVINLDGYMVAERPDNLESYYLFDANIARDFTLGKEKNKKVNLSFSIKNLFDQKPELVSGYPIQGRTYLLGISTEF